MAEVIPANFTPAFRKQLHSFIKFDGGPQYRVKVMVKQGFHPAFAKAIVRNITRKEGW